MNPNALRLRGPVRPLALAAALAALLALPAGAAVRLGTPGNDTLVGTNGKDAITGDAGEDTLKGLAGDDTYYFADGWDFDILEEKAIYRVGGKRLPGGSDTLSFRGVGRNGDGDGVIVELVPQWLGVDVRYNMAEGSNAALLLGNSVVENLVGSPQGDWLAGGSGANRLATGGGSDDQLVDYGGWDDGQLGRPELPPSDDTYAGAAANTGFVGVTDWGGTADLLDLRPLRSYEVVLNEIDCDEDPDKECLQIVTGTGDGQVVVFGHTGEYGDYTDTSGQQGRIETIRFADGAVSFGATAKRSGAARDGDALLGVAETRRQRQAAERAPELAKEAERQARRLPAPGALPEDRRP